MFRKPGRLEGNEQVTSIVIEVAEVIDPFVGELGRNSHCLDMTSIDLTRHWLPIRLVLEEPVLVRKVPMPAIVGDALRVVAPVGRVRIRRVVAKVEVSGTADLQSSGERG